MRYLAMNLPDLTGGPLGSIGMLGPGQVAMYNGAWPFRLDQLSFSDASWDSARATVAAPGMGIFAVLAIAALADLPYF